MSKFRECQKKTIGCSIPWQPQADGKGSYLELIDLNSDNSLALNRKASDNVLNINTVHQDASVDIYPNPTTKVLKIRSYGHQFTRYEITDLLGRVVLQSQVSSISEEGLDVSSLCPDIYLLKLYVDNQLRVVKKFAKH